MDSVEVLTDIASAVEQDTENVRTRLEQKRLWDGLLEGRPRHSNLYYVISKVYGAHIPEWFAQKYPDVEPDHWVIARNTVPFLKTG